MNLNPLKWKFSQWLTVITAIIFIGIRWNTWLVVADSEVGISAALSRTVFVNILPKLVSIGIFITLLFSFVYVFGIYYDITFEYLAIRIAIPAGILLLEAFLYFMFSQVIKMAFFWSHFAIELGAYILYALALSYCYKKVEFRLVEVTELERIEEEARMAARSGFKSVES